MAGTGERKGEKIIEHQTTGGPRQESFIQLLFSFHLFFFTLSLPRSDLLDAEIVGGEVVQEQGDGPQGQGNVVA
jgi:hypothetical protein